MKNYDIAVIGGGIVGCATAMALLGKEEKRPSLVVLEAEGELAAHQTGHNSGVIHSGLYYKPGSLKAKNCTRGRELLYDFCEENNVPYDRCGKIVVATDKGQIPALDELERRGRANGLEGIKRLKEEELKEYEPNVAGIAGLFVPQTGIVNFSKVTEAYGTIIKKRGGDIHLYTRVTSVNEERGGGFVVHTNQGDYHIKHIINCAGLRSDRVARMCGVEPGLQIIPFRGEYYELTPEKHHLVKNLIYPVPDPRFPFLGVHFTRMIDGGVEAGPNAVLALKREGYSKLSFSLPDVLAYGTYPGFWRMAAKYWQMGVGEVYRSVSKRAFVKALQALMPSLQMDDIEPAGSGVRAQALKPDGSLLDDFSIVEVKDHLFNQYWRDDIRASPRTIFRLAKRMSP
jgi:L-2-hydroxyglutarate oxidase